MPFSLKSTGTISLHTARITAAAALLAAGLATAEPAASPTAPAVAAPNVLPPVAAPSAQAALCGTAPVARPANRPVIGLVLSGGGARGAAHIGVLRVIEEAGIPVDLVVGTSMGSVVGGLYASGMPVSDIEKVVSDNDWNAVLEDGPPHRELSIPRKRELYDFHLGGRLGIGKNGVKLPPGLRQGQNVRLMLRGLTRHVADIECFDQLAVPFAAVGTDAETGEAVILNHGDIVTALRASMAIPGFFSPVEYDGRLLVDGGPANNMPVSIARQMGADIVIAIDIGTPMSKRDKLGDMFGLTMQMSTMLARLAADAERRGLKPEDVLIVPDLHEVTTMDFPEMSDAVKYGEEAAKVTLANYPWRNMRPASDLPSARFAGRYAETRKPATLGTITLEGNEKITPEKQVLDRLRLQQGDPLSDQTINEAITRAFGIDYFSTIDYRRKPGKDGDDLTLVLTPRNWGPDYLQGGLGLYTDFAGVERFTLGASYTKTQLNRLSGQLNAQLLIGSTQRFAAEIYQPMTMGAHLFVAPRLLHDRHTLDVWLKGNPVATYRPGRDDIGIDLGWSAGRYGELRLGYAASIQRLDLQVGVAVLPDFKYDANHARLVFGFDDYDAQNLPTRGSRIEFSSEVGTPSLGSDGTYERFRLRAGTVTSTFGQPLRLRLGLEQVDDHDTMVLEPAQLGGPFELAAFGYGEIQGNQTAFVQATTYRAINKLPGMALYVGGGLEYGGGWYGSTSDISESQATYGTDLYTVGSLFAGVDTPIGPMLLVAGFAEDQKRAVHLTLGYQF